MGNYVSQYNDFCSEQVQIRSSEARSSDIKELSDNLSADLASSVAPQWKDIVEWCEEATKLARLINDKVLIRDGNDKRSFIEGQEAIFFAKFIPFVHSDLLSPSYFLTEEGTCKMNTCTVDHLVDFPPFARWTVPIFYNSKVLIVIQTGSQLLSCDDNDSTALTKSKTYKNVNYSVISISKLRTVLALLRRLRNILLTGCQRFKDGPIQTINATSKPHNTQKSKNKNHWNGCEKWHEKEEWAKTKHNREIDDECIICLDRNTEIVLPCSHGFCTSCANSWIKENKHCPLCRSYLTRKDFDSEQWQLETWSPEDVAEYVETIENRIHSFFESAKFETQHKSYFFSKKDEFYKMTRHKKVHIQDYTIK